MAKRQTNKKDSIKKSESKIKEKKPELVERIEGLTSELSLVKSEQEATLKQIVATEEAKENMRQESVKKEETLKKEINKTGIKVAISALVIVLASIYFLFLIAFNQTDSPIRIILIASVFIWIASIIIAFCGNNLDTFFAFLVSVVLGMMLGIISIGYSGGPYSQNSWFIWIVGIVLSIILFVTITYASYRESRGLGKEFSYLTVNLLSLIFLIICVFGIVPLSRYHNINQIEHDKKIVEMLKITAEPNGIEILLSAEHASEHGYMKQVLCFKWLEQELAEAEQTQTWKKISDKCTKGEKVWYEARLDFLIFDTNYAYRKKIYDKKKEIILFFNHAWQDYEITKTIPLPDPNSG